MNAKLSIAALSLGFFAALAPSAAAGEFGISLGKQSKHGSLSLFYSNGGPAYGHASKVCAPVTTCSVPSRAWVRGHYESIPQQVWVASTERTVWVEPRYEVRYDNCGHAHTVCVAPGHWQRVCVPGHFETRTYKAFKPGAWVTVGT